MKFSGVLYITFKVVSTEKSIIGINNGRDMTKKIDDETLAFEANNAQNVNIVVIQLEVIKSVNNRLNILSILNAKKLWDIKTFNEIKIKHSNRLIIILMM